MASSSHHKSLRGAGDEVVVPVVLLSDIIEEAGLTRLDALKIDIEGFEDRALLPFFDVAPRAMCPKRDLMEVKHANRWQRDCVAELLGHGYAIDWQTEADILFNLPADCANCECGVVSLVEVGGHARN